MRIPFFSRNGKTPQMDRIADLLHAHFHPQRLDTLKVSSRTFPVHVRADLQRSLDQLFGQDAQVHRFCGINAQHMYMGIEFAGLLSQDYNPPTASPPQYDQVDIGEEKPIDCLKVGLWLLSAGGTHYGVMLSPSMLHGQIEGVKFDVITPADDRGEQIATNFLRRLESAVNRAVCYRGKTLSLEVNSNYSGKVGSITVHRLRRVEREQVILPRKTLDLLERNVVQFVEKRPQLRKFGQATKKGLLFYGPPGTGKTHTLHYLSRSLEGHTTLLISAEQVALLAEYMVLARLLQPSIVVIEDADLIARQREEMGSPCEEALLNRLLNEMDGLREDADILFILTTNRPQQLEAALASRPGRIDQAIEFPVPDDEGRRKLVRLYAQDIQVPEALLEEIVRRTEGVSAAFIKELMRRSVQFHLERADSGQIAHEDVDLALDELLFSGGSLNATLLAAGDGACRAAK